MQRLGRYPIQECTIRIGSALYNYTINVKGPSPRRKLLTCDKWGEYEFIESKKASGPSDGNKILILGFPHCGTSILRAKMGDCLSAMETTNETDYICRGLALNHPDHKIIIKSTDIETSPLIRGEINEENFLIPPHNNKIYHDYHSVLIIKNPYEVFGSLSRRFGASHVCNSDSIIHGFHTYEKFAKVWLKYRDGNEPRYNCIKYEEMFENDFKCLKNLFSKIGLKYEKNVFENRKNYYSLQRISPTESEDIHKFFKEKNKQPFDHQNEVYRTWQLHQKFKSFSDPDSHKDIEPVLLQRIKDSNIVKELGYSSPV